MFGEVRSDGRNEEGGSANPVLHKVGVHSDIGSHFAIPITGRLNFVETELEGILVERTTKFS